MKRFDLISDIHLDFWIKETGSVWKLRNAIKKLVLQLLPETCSNTLVIAGDLGHSNKQNYIFLKLMKEHYPNIALVMGNHDYYLEKAMLASSGRYDSMDRANEMMLLASQLPGVVYLDGQIVELDGIAFGGCGMWYDLQYGMQILQADSNRLFIEWQSVSNDYALIRGKPRHTLDMFEREKAKLDEVVAGAQVVVTHISPDWSRVPDGRELDLSTSFYYFDGAPYFDRIADKTWCFGHIHRRMDYVLHQCRFVNASLGYPRDNPIAPKKIVQVSI